MTQNNPIYPVGLFYVGPGGEGQSAILPMPDEQGNVPPDQMLPGGVRIKQEKLDDDAWNDQDSNSGIKPESTSVPVVTGVYSGDGAQVPMNQQTVNSMMVQDDDSQTSVSQNEAQSSSTEKDRDAEDRNSESYWEKRKRFTLAFAAGLRKFIQMHPELLRYGPKKNQNPASATVTSPPASEEEASRLREALRCGTCIACLRTEDCGKCAFCSDMKKFGGKEELKKPCIRRQCLHTDADKDNPSASQNAGTSRSNTVNEVEENIEADPTPRKKARKECPSEKETMFPVEVTIKSEAPEIMDE